MQGETVGRMLARGARVTWRCDVDLAHHGDMDLAAIVAAKGADFVLVDRRPPCRRPGCPGQAIFEDRTSVFARKLETITDRDAAWWDHSERRRVQLQALRWCMEMGRWVRGLNGGARCTTVADHYGGPRMTKIKGLPGFGTHDERAALISPEALEHNGALHSVVGSLMVGWSTSESVFASLLARILKIDHTNAAIIFFTIMGNEKRMKLMRALAKQNLTGENAATALGLIARFQKITTIRDRLAHADFVVDHGTLAYVATASIDVGAARPGADIHRRKPINNERFEEILKAAHDLVQINQELWVLIRNLE